MGRDGSRDAERCSSLHVLLESRNVIMMMTSIYGSSPKTKYLCPFAHSNIHWMSLKLLTAIDKISLHSYTLLKAPTNTSTHPAGMPPSSKPLVLILSPATPSHCQKLAAFGLLTPLPTHVNNPGPPRLKIPLSPGYLCHLMFKNVTKAVLVFVTCA